MVEAGQIDNRCGEGDIIKMAKAKARIDKALRVALNFARSNKETVVVVLADHETGGLVIGEGTRYHMVYRSNAIPYSG